MPDTMNDAAIVLIGGEYMQSPDRAIYHIRGDICYAKTQVASVGG